jgi:RHS repeat-associated protein
MGMTCVVGFTSKERDAETGLDYFGARYMSSAQGRFTSADPKQFNAKFLSNPQKWNKYAYTLNNPLALVDPDGREEVTVTYRAFIPQSQVSIGGFTFRGDNRTFSTAGTASSRIGISVRVETDPSVRSNPLIGTPQVSVGQTERISPFAAVGTATSGSSDSKCITGCERQRSDPD